MWMLFTTCAALAPQLSFQSQRTSAAAAPAPHATPLLSERGAPALPYAPAFFGRGVAAVDVDRDSRIDFVIGTASGAVLYRNTGGAGFVDESATRLPVGLPGTSQILVADVDRDGWQDLLLLADAVSGQDVLLLGRAPGRFAPPMPLPLLPTVSSDAEFIDVDSDGDLDLVRAIGASGHTSSAGRDQLLLNDGSGQFSVSPTFQSAPWNSTVVPSTSVVSFDANADGRLDLFITRADSGQATGSPGAKNQLLLGTPAGLFVDASHQLPDLADNSFDAVALDIDRDGDLDLVVANSVIGQGGAASGDVLVNQGGAQGGQHGVFLDHFGALEEAPIPAEAIRLGLLADDVDLDGHTDVLFRVHDLPPGGHQPLFLGQGGTFERATSFTTGSFVAAGGTFADIDGDGDSDLLLTAAGSAGGGSSLGNVRLYVNRTR